MVESHAVDPQPSYSRCAPTMPRRSHDYRHDQWSGDGYDKNAMIRRMARLEELEAAVAAHINPKPQHASPDDQAPVTSVTERESAQDTINRGFPNILLTFSRIFQARIVEKQPDSRTKTTEDLIDLPALLQEQQEQRAMLQLTRDALNKKSALLDETRRRLRLVEEKMDHFLRAAASLPAMHSSREEAQPQPEQPEPVLVVIEDDPSAVIEDNPSAELTDAEVKTTLEGVDINRNLPGEAEAQGVACVNKDSQEVSNPEESHVGRSMARKHSRRHGSLPAIALARSATLIEGATRAISSEEAKAKHFAQGIARAISSEELKRGMKMTTKGKSYQQIHDSVPIQPSIWYVAPLAGTWEAGGAASVFIILLLLVNISVQIIFLNIVINGLTVTHENRFDIAGFRNWRYKIAHDCAHHQYSTLGRAHVGAIIDGV